MHEGKVHNQRLAWGRPRAQHPIRSPTSNKCLMRDGHSVRQQVHCPYGRVVAPRARHPNGITSHACTQILYNLSNDSKGSAGPAVLSACAPVCP